MAEGPGPALLSEVPLPVLALVSVAHPLVTAQGAFLRVHFRTPRKHPATLRITATSPATRMAHRKHRTPMTTTACLRRQCPREVSLCSPLQLAVRLAKGSVPDQLRRRRRAKVAAAAFLARHSGRRVRLARPRPRREVPRMRSHQRLHLRSVRSKEAHLLAVPHRARRRRRLALARSDPLPRQVVASALSLAMLSAASRRKRKWKSGTSAAATTTSTTTKWHAKKERTHACANQLPLASPTHTHRRTRIHTHAHGTPIPTHTRTTRMTQT